ncbi:MAG: serine protease [Candidatus Rokubacteria bacterium]|nr:serine protease [Candidatus Rokubacteria bacterium]
MNARWLAALALLALPAAALAVGRPAAPRPDTRDLPAMPSYVQRVEPAVVALKVRADAKAPSSARLGRERFASAIVFDARGYAVTVSYAVIDALTIEAQTRTGQTLPARVTAIDFESGLAIVRLEGAGPFPVAPVGDSKDLANGTLTGTVGVDEDNDLVWVSGNVNGVRRFSAYWEYMLDRAIFVAPGSSSWAGSAVVNERGEVVGIVSLRLGQAPHVNLAIPIERLIAVKDELITAGRIVSRPPRPWLGLYTIVIDGAVLVDDVSPSGPARAAGFRKGDRIVGVNGVTVDTQEEFYEALWRGRAGDVIRVTVRREDAVRTIRVRSIDRHELLRGSGR